MNTGGIFFRYIYRKGEEFMRKIFALILLIFMCIIHEEAEASARFVAFPAIGTCTGTYVRYREDPDTESNILGRLHKPQNVIVLSQTASDGQVWYEIEDPESDSTAWVFGKYIVPLFSETTQRSELYPLLVNIMQNYGINKKKAELYSGPQVNTEYRNDNLAALEAFKKGNAFGDIHIGNDEEKLTDTLGIPDRKDGIKCTYIEGQDIFFVFYVENGKITRMSFATSEYFMK